MILLLTCFFELNSTLHSEKKLAENVADDKGSKIYRLLLKSMAMLKSALKRRKMEMWSQLLIQLLFRKNVSFFLSEFLSFFVINWFVSILHLFPTNSHRSKEK